MSIRLNKDMIGKKVKLVKIINKYNPDKIGAIGYITSYDEGDEDNKHYLVEWQVGSKWETWPRDDEIEEVKENNQINCTKEMTNEEIWKMLEGKMRKNVLKKKMGALYCNNKLTNGYWVYTLDDVHNAIALAYKVGYLRAMKGRPFKFGEKKKKGGHWEPVDPENLPKEGTRVKLKKEYINYYGGMVEPGETGIVFHGASYVTRVLGYGINFGKHKTVFLPLDRNIIANCLDMWVEDDE